MNEREAIEQAIAALEAQRHALGAELVEPALESLRRQLATLATAPQPDQQRKQLTFLFADVSDVTGLLRGVEPEVQLDMMAYLLQELAALVEAHGGQVARFMGDGLVAIFGHPVASEYDPDNAIRAGLAILAEAPRLAETTRARHRISGLALRVGINSGLAVLGGDVEAEYTTAGPAIVLAARLKSAAAPGALLISHDTYRLVRGAFDLQPLPPIMTKGFAQPTPVYRVLREKEFSFRTRRRGVAGIATHMIGRDDELERLRQLYLSVLATGKRQMATVVGEAGIGKSRLLFEFEHWVDLQPNPVWLFRGRARPETQRAPYSLWRNLFAGRFGLQDDDDAALIHRRIVAGFAQIMGSGNQTEMQAHFAGHLLGYDFAGSPHLPAVRDDPHQMRERARRAISDYFRRAAEQGPLLLLLEDLHWADASSLDLLTRLALELRDLPVSIVGAARPTLYERRSDWMQGRAFHQRLDLQPLSRTDSLQLVAELLQKVAQLPAELKELLVNRTEGNPFYVEELVKMLLEDGVIVPGVAQWHVHLDRLNKAQIPSTLVGVLQARLESLPPAERTILQQASVMGRIFWDDALCFANARISSDRISPYPVSRDPVSRDAAGLDDAAGLEAAVYRLLAALQQRELVYRQDVSAFSGADEFGFKHAITRDVAYETVLKRLRRNYHALAAEWLIGQQRAGSATHAGLIADHLINAGDAAGALPFLQQAGAAAAAAYANDEAVDYFSRALALVPDDRPMSRWQLLLAREEVLSLVGNRAAQAADLAAMAAMAAMAALSASGDDDSLAARTALRHAGYSYDISDYPAADEHSRRAVSLAGAAGDLTLEAEGRRIWGLSLTQQGQYSAALQQFEQTLEIARQLARPLARPLAQPLARPLAGQADGQLAGSSIAGWAYNNMGPVATALGDNAGARSYYRQALAAAQANGDRYLEGAALNNLGNTSWSMGEFQEATGHYEQAMAIQHAIGDRQGEMIGLNNLGVIAGDLGRYERARAYYTQALALARDLDDPRLERVLLSNLGGVAQSQGAYRQAQDYYEKALALARQIGDRPGEGYVLDGLCAALVSVGRPADAVEIGRQAISLREGIGQQQLAIESRATVAEAELAHNRPHAAAAEVAQVLAFVQAGGSLDGASHPLRIYLTCVRVLQAAGDPRAADLLATAHALLQVRAAKIQDEESRRFFLEQVPWNREIVRLSTGES